MVKKVIMKSVLATVAGVGLMASNAMAMSFNFAGEYTISDTPSSANHQFVDQISFASFDSIGSGRGKLDPDSYDKYLSVGTVTGGYVVISNLYINENDPYKFSPSSTVEGFKLYDYDTNQLLFSATLTAVELKIEQSTATVNSSLMLNLTDIALGVTDSQIANAFYKNGGGATNLTLNFGNVDLANLILTAGGNDGKGTITGSYSGSAVPVPEPGVTLLFGLGVAGFVGMIRRRNTLAD